MENSHLNRLPAEMRNDIFAMALKDDRTLDLLTDTESPLTRVCRQIRDDTVLVFYNLNRFNIDLHAYLDGDKHRRKCVDEEQMRGIADRLRLTRTRLAKLGDDKRKAISSLTLSIGLMEFGVLQGGFWLHAKQVWDDFKKDHLRYGMKCKTRCGSVPRVSVWDCSVSELSQRMKDQMGVFGLGFEIVR